MPIRPQHRRLYPFDWPQLSAVIRFERAMGRCESCRRPHGEVVCHLGDGRWWDASDSMWRDGRGRRLRPSSTLPSPFAAGLKETRVFLATAHLDHDPTNNRSRNLKAFCQRCHILNDASEHRRRRSLTFRSRKALGDLFLGPYPPSP